MLKIYLCDIIGDGTEDNLFRPDIPFKINWNGEDMRPSENKIKVVLDISQEQERMLIDYGCVEVK
jgi:hypothetical protein